MNYCAVQHECCDAPSRFRDRGGPSIGRGLIDADLGGGVIKQRVGRRGQGRSRGYRTLIAYRFGEFAVFLFGFAKSDRDNIDASELYVLRANAGQWLADSSKIARDAGAGILIEVKDDDDKS